jgi:hypothetical protein
LRPTTAAAAHVAIRSRGLEQWQRPKNIIGAESNDVPEYRRQALEAYLKECEEDCRRRIALCFRKTQQGVLAKEIFVMPMLTLLYETASNVTTSSSDLLSQFSSIMDSKIADSQKSN